MKYCIYRHTSPSGKVYIGQTCKKPKYRWSNGKGYENQILFYRAIKKYGWDNISHQILFSGLDKINADIIEEDLIYYYKQQGLSYNITNGGEGISGFHHSDEAKEKMKNAKLGRKQSSEHIQKAANSRKKPIIQYTLDGKFVAEYDSAKDAAEQLGVYASAINRCCNGNTKTSYNFKWRFIK